MSSSEFDRIIGQEQKVLRSIKDEGEKFILEFKQTATAYLRDWSIKLVRSYYSEKPEITKSLGAEKGEELKGEFMGILDLLPDQTSKRLDDSQIWLHREEIPDQALSDMTYSYQLEKRSKNAMDRAIKDLINPVGAMLIKFGYIEVQKDYLWHMTPGGLPQYSEDLPSRGMDHHQALLKLMEKYKNILIEYVFAIQNLRKAEQSKQTSQTDGF
jgi:hypothetical protein